MEKDKPKIIGGSVQNPIPIQHEQKSKIDESTLNFKDREPIDSPKRDEGCFSINLHVKEAPNDIINKIIPRGIGVKIHGRDVNNDYQTEGSIISVYCNNKTPSELDKREVEELEEYVSSNFSIVRDNPYETKQLKTNRVKIETQIVNEELADKAFNLYKVDNKIIGEL